MSLEFNATTDKALYNHASNLSSSAYTVLVQFMVPTGNSGAGWVVTAGNSASAVVNGIGYWVHGPGFQLGGYIGNMLDDQFTPTLDTWYQLEIVQGSVDDAALYVYDGTTRTTLRTRVDSAGTTTFDEICFGTQTTSRNGTAVGFKGSLRYAKFWKSKLSDAERNAERTSPTCVKAGGTSLWAMPDGTTGTDSISGYTLSITSGSTGASEPSYVTAGASVVISDAGDEAYQNGEVGIVITGTGFGASQGAGFVKISPTDDIDDAAAVTQTVTSWADTSITITAVKGSLALDTSLYLFVEENTGTSNASGHVVQFWDSGSPIVSYVRPIVFVTDTIIQY